MTSRPITLILDSSAVIAFAQGSIDVGESIVEARNDNCRVGIPVPCLVESQQAYVDDAILDVLLGNPAVTLLGVDGEDWSALADIYDVVGRIEAAVAALAASDVDAMILTRRPGVYAGLENGGPVIPIG